MSSREKGCLALLAPRLQTAWGMLGPSRLASQPFWRKQELLKFPTQTPHANSGTTRMNATRQYDNLNRLLQVKNTPSADAEIGFGYQYNDANQRTRVDTSVDSAFWAYDYDKLGQVTSGKKYWSDNTPVAGQQFEYSFDEIGNRTQTKSGGDSLGGNLRVASYENKNLNQLTNRAVPGTLDVIGNALAGATVTVNSQATTRKGSYFHAAVPVNNGTTNVYQSITNVATLGGSFITNGNVFVPKNTEVLKYDLDGNLTNDGRWTLTWDGENRLISMISTNVVDAAKKKILFNYDWRGRRVSKLLSNYVSGAWQLATNQTFVYDGWNLFLLNGSGGVRFFTHGTDLSGTMQGAGGVGGLLGILEQGTTSSNYFVAYDGNGNVAGLVSAHNGTISAQYEYDPFGNVVRSTGTKALMNPLRFSSKYQDDESGWSYYGYRYYNPVVGRWVSRDPIEEVGGLNLYGFVENAPSLRFDALGLIGWVVPPSTMGAAYAKQFCEYKLSGGLASSFNQSTTQPSLGNQLQGYPPGTDFTRYFQKNQPRQLALRIQQARNAIQAAITRRCRTGGRMWSFSADESGQLENAFVLSGPDVLPTITITPNYQVGIRRNVSNFELPGDTPQTLLQSRAALGRYNWTLGKVSVQQVFCSCEPCYFWSAELTATDTPGISGEDHWWGWVLSGWGVPTDSPSVPIAKWKVSGVTCCGRN